MKKIILFAVILILLVFAPYTITWGGEKAELQWKAKALIAEFQLAQKEYQKANDALQAFQVELDQKGFIYKDGVIVEKPKETPKPPPKSGK